MVVVAAYVVQLDVVQVVAEICGSCWRDQLCVFSAANNTKIIGMISSKDDQGVIVQECGCASDRAIDLNDVVEAAFQRLRVNVRLDHQEKTVRVAGKYFDCGLGGGVEI